MELNGVFKGVRLLICAELNLRKRYDPWLDERPMMSNKVSCSQLQGESIRISGHLQFYHPWGTGRVFFFTEVKVSDFCKLQDPCGR